MKKTIAVALITIYLCNIGGQLVLHQYLSYLSEKFFKEQTNKGLYDKNDLTEVKIPVNMPNITDWTGYACVSGQIQFEDVSYNYVKMKVTRTAIYLKCVPNYNTTHLFSQNVIVAKNIKGPPVLPKNHVPYSKNALLSQLTVASTSYEFTTPVKYTRLMLIRLFQPLLYRRQAIPDQPPRSIC
ncbi:hypothetical protein JN11_01874 [Mucilaginibacter frigoritolerans]|uniref:Uncharacterized protein n=1 Tax=Mucilaginibacter frigoritolerans TaxID=652788 RepID=A0A562U4D0_9SPHI|nr:hypothetical protein [Mucilaginibacter frigoritolerans]TWJ00618.1 hypothetical protein JN11_01874 [Mucilaginibacter frigoritolerans]